MSRGFYLVMMTIFAVLFLFTFFAYKSTSSQLKVCRSRLLTLESGKLIEPIPSDPELYEVLMGRGLLEMSRKNYGRAEEFLRSARRVASSSRELAESSLALAQALYELGKYEEAFEVLYVFLKQPLPMEGEGLVELARVCVKLGREDVLGEIKKRLEKKPAYAKKLEEVIGR